ncbi:family 78 glycoside hydrolase catalytic domain [Paenibacillus polymyxa]|uniref:alpha-L-rhamnosidase n=1 Tax=Paenibacillus TaxID=44249 RepID=UPI000F4FEA63|nr:MULTISPECIES: alpha-L-rhamnosidase [Paenibacillus]KAF6659394.1 family 78 glycoside hydrolase catalytic domain [Paenibacillus sp. EKM301P]RPE01897.1 alpha-L-rhamnosidase [Paenibacillus polymyxa]UBS85942.1 glycoside hydrolase family 78 protein [Paenibacillus polymyxa]WHX34467.1 family 78 glycoside hydrolase catalytic domain [Paenibacillus polymyxa]
MLKVKALRCEHLNNPIGLGCLKPRLSWQIESDNIYVFQKRFQLQVSIHPTFEPLIWNHFSYSEQSILFPYGGPPLESGQRYYYRVKVWAQGAGDIEPEESEWSEFGFWEMGLLSEQDWKAEWITVKERSLHEQFQTRAPFAASKCFSVEGKVKKAVIYATSLGLYELELNGQRVGDAYFTPGWTDYNDRVQVQAYDVTSTIREQHNRITATVGEGWYSGYLGWQKRKDTYGNTNALLFQMKISYEDGRSELICSDSSWEETSCAILMSDIYNGEIYDARLEQQAGEHRSLNERKMMQVVPFPLSHLVAQENEPVRVMNRLKPVELIQTPKGELVLNLGQNMVGWLEFKVEAPEGTVLNLIHGEVLDQQGNFYRDNIRDAAQQITYICSGKGTEIFRPHFTFQGFQYVKLEGFPAGVDIEDFTGVVLHSDMETIGLFETSDPKLNQLQHNIVWGQKGNFLDVPTDCPQRDERLGWTGDAQIFARTASFNMNSASFFRKWLKDLAYNQLENGAVPFVVPDVLKGTFADNMDKTTAAWGDAAVICPWTIYQCYGDKQILAQQYDSMKAWVDYIRAQGTEEHLWDSGLQLGDWLALDSEEGSYFGATDGTLVATAYFAYSTHILAQTAKLLNRYTDYNTYQSLHEGIKAAFADRYFDDAGKLTSNTQTAQVVALHFGLVPERYKKQVIQELVRLIEKNDMHLDTGFVGTPYLCLVLSDNGYTDVAYKILFQKDYPSWLYQVERGATTMWEHWDSIKVDGSFWSTDMNSFNHYSYGSVGDFMYQNIAGIDVLEAGYKKSRLAPKPPINLTSAHGKLETPYGALAVHWKIVNEEMQMTVHVPHNTTAEITLPGVMELDTLQQTITTQYPSIQYPPGNVPQELAGELGSTGEQATFQKSGDHELTFTAGSGQYTFQYKYNQRLNNID